MPHTVPGIFLVIQKQKKRNNQVIHEANKIFFSKWLFIHIIKGQEVWNKLRPLADQRRQFGIDRVASLWRRELNLALKVG